MSLLFSDQSYTKYYPRLSKIRSPASAFCLSNSWYYL